MSKTGHGIVLALVLAVAAGAGFGAAWWWRAHAAAAVTDAAPDLSFTDLEGKPRQLSAWRGKVVLVNFWATWCAPCMDELPLLVKVQAEFAARGLQVVGPAMDDADAVKPMIPRFGINYPVSADFNAADAAMRAFGNDQGALPFSVLISRDGHIVQRLLGGLHEDDLRKLLTEQLDS